MRQFISPYAPDKKGLLEISGKDYRYLRQVLRVKPGDMLLVRLPDQSLVNTTVCDVREDKKIIVLQLADSGESITRGVQADEVQNEAGVTEYFLFQYIAKPVKMEQIIRQAVECGVKYVVPVIGEFSQKSSVLSIKGGKQERLERIVKEARQQSGSPVETQILDPCTTEEAVKFWNSKIAEHGADEACGIVLWERSDETLPLFKALPKASDGSFEILKKAAVVVGCEGGISPDEIKLLKAGNFKSVHFATNILRCETAALYGIAAVQSAMISQF